MLINLEELENTKLLTSDDLKLDNTFSESYVDFGKVIQIKFDILEKAFSNFYEKRPQMLKKEFFRFKREHKYWLEDYSLFMSIKNEHNLDPWNKWEDGLRFREILEIQSWKRDYRKEIELHEFLQFLFFNQWLRLKTYANSKKIHIIGDIPIFVAYDSADVWAHPEFYYLNDKRELLYVAGVPPDYFSETGQRWGNPLYRWDLLKSYNYDWWIKRIRHNFILIDLLRIDHFRGFESYWQISANEPTAVNGKWIPGPGVDLFNKIKKELGPLPIIAEDLGLITPSVKELLYQTDFPGMRVLQFAFGDDLDNYPENNYLPHNYIKNTVVYTGTHDNDTTRSWFDKCTPKIKKKILEYTNSDGEDIVKDLIRLAWSSVAQMAVIPLQDLLRLGNEGRMNLPGTLGENWRWRFNWEQLTEEKGEEILTLSRIYER